VRAFLGQFDRASLGVLLLGAAIGVVWLVALDLGIALAGMTLLVGSVALIVHHRWIEIALLMVGIGLVVQVGYWSFGVPPEPPTVIDPGALGGYGLPVVAEAFAPGMAGLILIGGVILGVVVGAWDLWEGRRRERLDERHRRRRARQIADSPEVDLGR
jgi:hypothetical protein